MKYELKPKLIINEFPDGIKARIEETKIEELEFKTPSELIDYLGKRYTSQTVRTLVFGITPILIGIGALAGNLLRALSGVDIIPGEPVNNLITNGTPLVIDSLIIGGGIHFTWKFGNQLIRTEQLQQQYNTKYLPPSKDEEVEARFRILEEEQKKPPSSPD